MLKSLSSFGFHSEPLSIGKECSKHGEYTSLCFVRNIWTSCPHCADEINKKELEKKLEKERGIKIMELQKRINNSLIPQRYKQSLFDNYFVDKSEQRQIFSYCNRYSERFDEVMKRGLSMIFIGKSGTGKTHLACAIANHVLKNNYDALYSTSSRIFGAIKSSWHKSSNETSEQIMDKYILPSLLIIDDVGGDFDSKTEKKILVDIIKERYSQSKPMVIISNYHSKEELKNYLGENTIECLQDNGGKVHLFCWNRFVKK